MTYYFEIKEVQVNFIILMTDKFLLIILINLIPADVGVTRTDESG